MLRLATLTARVSGGEAVSSTTTMTRGLLWLAVCANAAAAALTLLLPDVLLGPAVMNGSARGTALIMLLLGVPLLMGSELAEGRWPRAALVVRIGAFAYLAYNGFMLLLATPFNRLFLVYCAALGSTVFAFGLQLANVRRASIEERLPVMPARIVGGYILAIVVLNVLAWLQKIVPALFAADPTSFLDGTGIATNPVFVLDLVFWLPSAALIGWLTWTRRPWGALLAGGYLVYGVVESIGVGVDQWLGYSADPTTPHATLGAVYLFAVLAVIGVVALTYYARSGRPASVARLSVSLTVTR
jgi:hypothetical protein